MGRPGDRGEILDLEGERSRTLGVDGPGVGTEKRSDPFADLRVVETRLDTEPSKNSAGEGTGRQIGRVRNEDVIARYQTGQQRRDDCRLAGTSRHGHVASLEFAVGILERVRRRRAVTAIDNLPWILAAAFPERLERLEQHGGGMVDGRIDDSVIVVRVAPGGHC